jgi:hypothetical protein
VLAAADAAAGPRSFPQQFGKQSPHIASKSHVMAMTAMIGKNEIHFFQLPCKCNSGKLLTDAGMNSTIQLTLGKQLQKLFLYFPDPERLLDDPVIDY